MTQERFSNLTVLNSQKERTTKFEPPPAHHHYHFITGGHQPQHFKNCSAGPALLRVSVLGLQPRDQQASCHVGVQYNKQFLEVLT